MLCRHLAVFLSVGFLRRLDCASWVAAVCVRLVCWGTCDVVLVVVPAGGGFLGEPVYGDNGCDGMSLVGES